MADAAPPPDPSIQDIIANASQRLNYPSAQKLYDWLRNHGHVVTFDQIKKFTEKQAVRQVFHQPVRTPASKQGQIVSLGLNERWMADLVDLTAQPSGGSGSGEGGSSGSKDAPIRSFRYILVVQNVFSRELHAKPLKSKDPETVAEAFRSILDDAPKPGRLDTDNGAEFQGPFDHFLEEKGIQHVTKDPQDKNALGTIDRAIQLLKQALFRRVVAENNKDWAALLPATVRGMNDTVHSKLNGRTPEEVKDDPVLQFDLRHAASDALARNHDVIEARGHELARKGAFRPADAQRTFQRSFQPKYSDEVHQVAAVEGSNVVDEQGRKFPTKRVLGVPAGSANVAAGAAQGMRGGSVLIDNLRKASVAPFAHRLEEFLGLDTFTLPRVVAKMKQLGMAQLMVRGLNYKLALELLGFKVEAGAAGGLVVRGKRARTPAARPRFRAGVLNPQPPAPAPAAFQPRPRFRSGVLDAGAAAAANPVPAPAARRRRTLTAFEEAQRFLNTPYFGNSRMDARGNLI